MPATTTTPMTKFAIRTTDEAWIKRNNGVTDDDSRTIVLVPAAKVEHVTICGNAMLRTTLTDCPSDFARVALCPAAWVA
jgi:hypothetical protein